MLPFAVATESFGGNKTHEIKRERRSFEENTSVLSDYMFRRAFRMTRSTFDKLFGILKTGLENRFLSKGGGKRDPKKRRWAEARSWLDVLLAASSNIGNP